MIEQVGPYRLLHELGRGGMGSVYAGVHVETGSRVAVKLCTALEALGDEGRARFAREAEALGRLSHPAIVRVHAAGLEDPPYLVQALLEGGSLADRLRQGPLSIDDALAVVRRVGEALVHAHERGVLHRDLKPGNVLFDAQGRAHLADFGLASVRGAGGLTATGEVLGTPSYMAPEQAEDAKRAGVPADVYGLGGLLYACLCGRGPFDDAQGVVQRLNALLTRPPTPVESLRPGVPPALSTVCSRALAKDPSDRYPDVRSLLAALEASPRTGRAPPWAAALAIAIALTAGAAAAVREAASRSSAPAVASAAPRPTVELAPVVSLSGPLGPTAEAVESAVKLLETCGADVQTVLTSHVSSDRGESRRLFRGLIGRAQAAARVLPDDHPGRLQAQRWIASLIAALSVLDEHEGLEALRDKALELGAEPEARAWLDAAAVYGLSRHERQPTRIRWQLWDRAFAVLRASERPKAKLPRFWRVAGAAHMRQHPPLRWSGERPVGSAELERVLGWVSGNDPELFLFAGSRSDARQIVECLAFDGVLESWLRSRAASDAQGVGLSGRLDALERRWELPLLGHRVIAALLERDTGRARELLAPAVRRGEIAIHDEAPVVAMFKGELALLDPEPDLDAARAAFERAVRLGGALGTKTHQVGAVLGLLHVRVLRDPNARPQVRREFERLQSRWDDIVPYGFDTVGAFWHLPEWFAGTLEGEWWPGQ